MSSTITESLRSRINSSEAKSSDLISDESEISLGCTCVIETSVLEGGGVSIRVCGRPVEWMVQEKGAKFDNFMEVCSDHVGYVIRENTVYTVAPIGMKLRPPTLSELFERNTRERENEPIGFDPDDYPIS